MKKLLLITKGYPLDATEKPFLETEYKYLNQYFELFVLAISEKQLVNKKYTNIYKYQPSGLNKAKAIIHQFSSRQLVNEIRKIVFSTNKFKLKAIRHTVGFSIKAFELREIIDRIVVENNIDVIYTYWCQPETLTSLLVKEKRHIKVITRFHGFDLYLDRTECDWQPFQSVVANQCDRLIFACKYAMEYYLSYHAIANERSYVSYLGTEKRKKVKKNELEVFTVISCSSIIPLKRVEVIAKSILLASRQIKIRWIHIGGPKIEYDFLDRENVTYLITGEISHNQVIETYYKYTPDIFITTSSSEGGTPVSIQEAFSMGVPAIGTSIGGIPDIIHSKINGYLVGVNDSAEQIAQVIIEYYKLTTKEKKEYRLNSYMTWKNKFDATENAKHLCEMLDKI